MLDELVIATTNPGKRREFEAALGGLAKKLTPLPDGFRMPEETGETFLENARLKARAVATSLGIPALADDSGLVVDGLGGAPGVHSARFGGEGLSDGDRRRLVLEALRDANSSSRRARFVAALVLMLPSGEAVEAVGECQGEIAAEERGYGGFGYDPIFFYPPLGCTFGELPLAKKEQVSHRAEALRELSRLLGRQPLHPGGKSL